MSEVLTLSVSPRLFVNRYDAAMQEYILAHEELKYLIDHDACVEEIYAANFRCEQTAIILDAAFKLKNNLTRL